MPVSYHTSNNYMLRLLRACTEIQHTESSHYVSIVRKCQTEETQVAQNYIKSPEIVSHLVGKIEEVCTQVIHLLAAMQILGESTPRSVDKIVSTGEKLSGFFLAALLRDRGVMAEYIDLSDVIDPKPGTQLNRDFYDELAAKTGNIVLACEAKVVVVTGFFGAIPGGLLDTIGRGYSDLCAALVAVGVGAAELQIWKEVDGIFTADPRKVHTASLITEITAAEVSELGHFGSEVIHPLAMEQVIRARIPVRVKNVTNPSAYGTVVYADYSSASPLDQLGRSSSEDASSASSSALSDIWMPKRPTAMTIKGEVLVVNVNSNKRLVTHDFLVKVFYVLDKWKLIIDLVSSSQAEISMAIHCDAVLPTAEGKPGDQVIDQDICGAIDELKTHGAVRLTSKMAILSLVGKEMSHTTGMAGHMFSILGQSGVNIEMISQGMRYSISFSSY